MSSEPELSSEPETKLWYGEIIAALFQAIVCSLFYRHWALSSHIVKKMGFFG